MNLIRDPWIPVLHRDGRLELLGLHALFAQSHELRDLATRPLERVAVMRLLSCITQAALDGPADETDWETCEARIQTKVDAYLTSWEPQFELFGDGHRFLQVPGLEPGKVDDDGNAATKLDLAMATGNNASLFDNAAGSERVMSPVRSAMNLLTFQCFAPGGRIGIARWNGTATAGNGSSKHAPCTPSSMVHALIQGESILQTIHRNLLTREMVADVYDGRWGQPVWEQPPQHASDNAAIANTSSTYLGRLVPVSRAIRLMADGSSVILANGLAYPIFPAYREATATIITRKDEWALLSASPGRSLWRQLGAVTVVHRAKSDVQCGPLALRHTTESAGTTLWVGALLTEKAKILDIVESTYALPSGMFEEFGRLAYEAGISHAMQRELSLMQAVKTYASSLKVDTPAYDRARRDFWTFCEQHLTALFELAANPELTVDLAGSAWGKAVREASLHAFESACPTQTPRQIEAYARAIPKLTAASRNSTSAPLTHA